MCHISPNAMPQSRTGERRSFKISVDHPPPVSCFVMNAVTMRAARLSFSGICTTKQRRLSTQHSLKCRHLAGVYDNACRCLFLLSALPNVHTSFLLPRSSLNRI